MVSLILMDVLSLRLYWFLCTSVIYYVILSFLEKPY